MRLLGGRRTWILLLSMIAGVSAPLAALSSSQASPLVFGAPIPMGTFAPPEVSPYPTDGAAGVPTNARVLFRHFQSQVNGTTARVLVAGSALTGTWAQLANPGALTPEWDEFRPSGPMPGNAMVTVVVDSASGLAAQQSTVFQVGTSTDATAPSGGEILAASAFYGSEDASGKPRYGYTITFNAANDAGGPAWIHATIAATDGVTGLLTTDTRMVEGSTYGIDGGDFSLSSSVAKGTRIVVTAYAADLAGNQSSEFTTSFTAGPAEDDGGLCAIARGGIPAREGPSLGWSFGWLLGLAALVLSMSRRL